MAKDAQRDQDRLALPLPPEAMARNPAQGSGAMSGAPRSPTPSPEPPSASGERLARLHSNIDDVRQTLRDRIESLGHEITGLQRALALEIRGDKTRGKLGLKS